MCYATKKIAFFYVGIFCAMMMPQKIHSQNSLSSLESINGQLEAGITAGATAFFGDLGGNKGAGQPFIKDFNSVTTRPLAGGHIDYFANKWLCVKLSLNYTNVDGADSLIKNKGTEERWRYYRNLSFRSRIAEASTSAELYPLLMFNKNADIQKINPYFGVGLGLFHFNPQTMYCGQWVNLKPLHTEGEGFPGTDPATGKAYPKNYHLLQAFIPITVGIKIYLSNVFAVSAGFTFRHTFTDYIDDVHSVYINPALFGKYLPPAQAAMAQQLYSRSLTPWKVKNGILKADPSNNDSYTDMFLTLSIRLPHGPRFYSGNSVLSRRQGRKMAPACYFK